MKRIFPLNLTARASVQITGNPVTTRLESGVGNCYPGLEFDHRNLDRRFFPGLVFEFVTTASREAQLRQGARLAAVDENDVELNAATFEARPADKPDEKTQRKLLAALRGPTGKTLREGVWFLESITQSGKTITLRDNRTPLDGMTVWRLVRSLERGPVKITLARRPDTPGGRVPPPSTLQLSGWRRSFTDSNTGTISEAYAPGELTQSLCSPWMHDFRDCACFYWASNHPDIVLGASEPGEPTLPNAEPEDPERANTPIDWLRSDRARSRTTPAEGDEASNRRAEMDHYEINKRWQDLSIVLMGRELAGVFEPRPIETKTPFRTPDELAQRLVELATLEHVLVLEYLYARYSILHPDRATDGRLKQDLIFVRHEMLFIAVSEMRHLRWVNQLLWELDHQRLTSKRFGPSLEIAARVPAQGGKLRDRELRLLTPMVLDDFIAVEEPSGFLDGQYASVLTTLRDKATYQEPLAQLAARIIADGTQHYSQFREIRTVLKPYFELKNPPYLVSITPAPPGDAGARKVLAEYQKILDSLRAAYEKGDAEDFGLVATARADMFDLDAGAERLAARGLGIPFF